MIACKQTIIILIRIWSLLELVHVWVNTRLLQVFGVGHLPLVESSHVREGLEAGIDGDVIYLAGAGMNHGVSFTGPRMVRLSATMWGLAGLLLAFLIRLAVFALPGLPDHHPEFLHFVILVQADMGARCLAARKDSAIRTGP